MGAAGLSNWCATLDRHASSDFLFFFNDTATTEIYTLSLHDALPISRAPCRSRRGPARPQWTAGARPRSEEHTSELQSRSDLVCRLLLEKKKPCCSPKTRRTGSRHGRVSPRVLCFETLVL